MYYLSTRNSNCKVTAAQAIAQGISNEGGPASYTHLMCIRDSYQVVDQVTKLSQKPDVAILATPTRSVEKFALECLENGINTVDSFDIHTKIWDLRETLDKAAKEHSRVSIISAGWDPGSDSVVRTLMQACAPKGLTYTNFGPCLLYTSRCV